MIAVSDRMIAFAVIIGSFSAYLLDCGLILIYRCLVDVYVMRLGAGLLALQHCSTAALHIIWSDTVNETS
jgi:hypothetical protein